MRLRRPSTTTTSFPAGERASHALASASHARRPLRRILSRGRDRAASLADTIADDMPELVDDVRREATPLIERAMGRSRPRHRKRNAVLALVALGAVVGVLYWLWRRQDMEPAYLAEEPDRPNVTPAAGSPAPSAPAPGPWGSDGGPEREDSTQMGEDRPATAQAAHPAHA